MKISKEAKAGILVIITLGVFVWGFNMLKGRNIFSSDRFFYAVYENIDGLVRSSPVYVKGFKVGIVRSISFYEGDNSKVVVMFSITNDDLTIPDSTIAKITSSDFLGTKSIELQIRNGKKFLSDGDTLLSAIDPGLKDQVSKQVEPIKKKAEALLASIDSVMTIVQAILDKDARNSLTASFESVKRALATFEKTALKIDGLVESEAGKLSSILSKIESITSTIAKNNEKLSSALGNINTMSDSLAKSNLKSTINNTNLALANANIILEKINKGEGTIGMMLNDKKLYNQLDSTNAQLNSLLKDMEENPWRYFSLYGKKKRTKKPKTP